MIKQNKKIQNEKKNRKDFIIFLNIFSVILLFNPRLYLHLLLPYSQRS